MTFLSIYSCKEIAGNPRFIKVFQGFFGEKRAFFALVFLISDISRFYSLGSSQILGIIAHKKGWGNSGEY
ncbi:hypothetical protein [Planktothrix sp. FACHB-1355]|uniref:hypothetical protein n=1 Tax=Planktothrix sp. FACHB-1355 TaxID=2692854 RepID=UPI00168A9FA8|nr:hypothetical protein [Planktothrix sp. FACHB-1355]